jgi:hypothetical protein
MVSSGGGLVLEISSIQGEGVNSSDLVDNFSAKSKKFSKFFFFVIEVLDF